MKTLRTTYHLRSRSHFCTDAS